MESGPSRNTRAAVFASLILLLAAAGCVSRLPEKSEAEDPYRKFPLSEPDKAGAVDERFE